MLFQLKAPRPVLLLPDIFSGVRKRINENSLYSFSSSTSLDDGCCTVTLTLVKVKIIIIKLLNEVPQH